MSNPDFPGPSWQDRPGYSDEPPAYGGRHRDNGDYANGDSYRNGDRAYGDEGYSGRDDYIRDRDDYRGGRDGRAGRGGDDGRDQFGPGRDAPRNPREGLRRGDRHAAGGRGRRDYEPGSYESYGDYAGEATAGVSGAGYDDSGGYDGGRRRGYDETGGYGRSRTMVRRGARSDFEGPGGPRRPGGPGGRRPGQAARQSRPWHAGWWKHWTWRKAGLVTGAIAGMMALVMIAAFFAVYTMIKVPVSLLSAQVLQSSTVYFADGKTEVGCFCSTSSTTNVLTEDQVAQSTNLVHAVLAAEDRNFQSEGGISVSGLMRAMQATITGSGIQGGSTITEQLVKRVYENISSGNLTYKQKLEEIIVAIKLAKVKSKSWILTHYLNDIYLGSGANGAGDAAEVYFGVPAQNLTVAQAAMIAAMIQAPGRYDPYHPDAVVSYLGNSLKARWEYVLTNMARDGDITQAQADAMQFPAVRPYAPGAAATWSGYRGYIMTAIETELKARYGYTSFDQISAAGLRIVSTFSKAKMDALYASVKDMKALITQYGGSWPTWARLGAVLEDPKTGAIQAMYGGPNSSLPKKQCEQVDCSYNMALSARNQVGSSFKPYVLATAASMGMNVQTSVLNGTSPLCVPPDDSSQNRAMLSMPLKGSSCPTLWGKVTPDNATKNGPVTVAAATAASSNPAYVDLAHFVGTDNVVRMAKNLGVNISSTADGGSNLTNMLGQTGIALGIASLTVEEQTSTFATIANGGYYIQPHVIDKLYKDGQLVPPNNKSYQALQAPVAADVAWALSFDNNSGSGYRGTGTNANLSSYRPMIGKTGTTDNYQGAYFLGALPGQYSFTVGMFTAHPNNKQESLGTLPGVGAWSSGGYGGAWAATLWKLYMNRVVAMDNAPVASIPALQLDPNFFSTWVREQLLPPKQKCGKGGPGGGPSPTVSASPGASQSPCPSQSPSPSGSSPSPTTSPTPSPTVSATSPTPSPPISIPPPG